MKTNLTTAANRWTHLGLATVIAAEASFILLGSRRLMPACRRLILLSGVSPGDAFGFMPGGKLLAGLLAQASVNLPWLIAALVAGWILFEWSVRGEKNRTLRVSVMTSMSLVLFCLAVAFSVLMVVPAVEAGQRMSARHPEPVVASQMAALDRLMYELDDAVAKRDWPATHSISHEGSGTAQNLVLIGGTAAALLTVNQQPRIDDVRAHVELVRSYMFEIWVASTSNGEADRIETAMKGLHTAYGELKAEIPEQ